MAGQSNTNNIEAGRGAAPKADRAGFASLIIALAAIAAFHVSIHRIKTLQNRHVCIVRETLPYRAANTLCSVLPAASVAFGVLSLIRYGRKKGRFTTAIPALAGIIVSVASAVVYCVVLLALAEGPVH